MSDACEFLERRSVGDDGESFEHERPYCTAVEAFVQPMRADICAKRYGLDPETDCEHYREAKGLGSVTGLDGDAVDDGASTPTGGDES